MSDREQAVAQALGEISSLRATRHQLRAEVAAIRATRSQSTIRYERKVLGHKIKNLTDQIRDLKAQIIRLDKSIYQLFEIPYN